MYTLITSVLSKQYWYFVRSAYDIFLDSLFTRMVYFHTIVHTLDILRHTFFTHSMTRYIAKKCLGVNKYMNLRLPTNI